LGHYACMVDLLGRRGLFNEIMDLGNEMPMELIHPFGELY